MYSHITSQVILPIVSQEKKGSILLVESFYQLFLSNDIIMTRSFYKTPCTSGGCTFFHGTSAWNLLRTASCEDGFHLYTLSIVIHSTACFIYKNYLFPGGPRENHLSGPLGTLKLEQAIFICVHFPASWSDLLRNAALPFPIHTLKSTAHFLIPTSWLVTVALVVGPTSTVFLVQ